MSGGHFDYDNYRLTEIADSLDSLVLTNSKKDEYGYSRDYPPEILDIFKKAEQDCRQLERILHEIDYLVCGDTGEETFLERIKKRDQIL